MISFANSFCHPDEQRFCTDEQLSCHSDEGGISWSCTKGNYTICASPKNLRSINLGGDHKEKTVKTFSIKGLGRFAYGYQSMNVNYFVREAAITGSTFAFQNKQRCLLIQQAFLLISTYENNCVLHHQKAKEIHLPGKSGRRIDCVWR